ncbi:MAG TPA: kelch repeat-containing protein [Puia sp.]|nr:kelch repeat-containing protein [Puia sp.]
MKRFHHSILLMSVIVIALSSCQSSSINPTQDGNWVYVGDFGGKAARTEAVSFVIGDYAYVGFGVDNQNTRYNDLYRFDPSGTFWYQVATCTACTPRSSAVAFAVNGKGYVGTGYDGYQALSDFWQYDPGANSWKQVSSIGDINGPQPRYDAVAFGIDKYGYGYVGTGNDGVNLLNDFWQYDPANDVWTQKPTYPGYKRSQAVAFVYNDKGYLVTGVGTGGSTVNDFFSFDPSKPDTSAWTQLRHISNYSPDSYDDGYTNIVRSNGVGFVMLGTKSDGGGDRAYITTGSAGSTTWAYNFATDLWNQKTSYERAARNGAVGFTVQNRGFVGLGTTGSTTLSNIDEWFPDETYNQQD